MTLGELSMSFEWVAIAMGDVLWISIAFVMGLASRSIGLPPLVGYLAAGFALNLTGFVSGDMLETLADLGITLLLFTVGLKLNLKTFARPQVWAVTVLHTSLVVLLIASVFVGLTFLSVPMISQLSFEQMAIVAFALSFSSTVFVVKMLEEKGEVASLHGRIAIGILIVQDIAAVIFLAASAGQWPTLWALLLLLLIPARPILLRLLQTVGHGELLVLYGFILALGGAELFELVGVKGDLGALVLGVLIATHPKGEELGKQMMSFKDLFLLGFFLSIGFSGHLTAQALLIGAVLTPLILLKSAIFYVLLTRFRLRARTALLSSVSLANFSEFGLIVAAISVASGWLAGDWLVVMSIALSFSFAIAAFLNVRTQRIYERYQPVWLRAQRNERLPDDEPPQIGNARVAVIGMGGVGTGTFDVLVNQFGSEVVGIDIDAATVANHRAAGRPVFHGDPSDADFWDRVSKTHALDTVLLALPKVSTSLAVLKQLQQSGIEGSIAAIARFRDEESLLLDAGANTVFNIYTEVGAGFAAHVLSALPNFPGAAGRRDRSS